MCAIERSEQPCLYRGTTWYCLSVVYEKPVEKCENPSKNIVSAVVNNGIKVIMHNSAEVKADCCTPELEPGH